ncbi:hypothetical protein BE08_41625 [Sorangium cellulosum]|uniref:Transposase n=1 Tax=Sorangium cellulosum TaxID=56 RepID=A0A150PEJ6_SORCE|nr:hypothetical protein BE08_41625 [Sorangium cellulosum]
MQERSSCRIVQADVDIKRWMTVLPTVDLVRPARCPCCDAAGRPVNGPLVMRGHGLRERLVCGPLEAGGAPQHVTVQARRYRCSACGAIVLVVPRGLLRRRRYSAAAIGWVLARIGLDGATTTVARAEVCPSATLGVAAAERWLAPSRWIEASRRGQLFPRLGRHGAESTRAQIAERTAMQLVGLSPQGSTREPAPYLAFRGAALAA